VVWALGAVLLIAAPASAGVDDALRDSAVRLSAGDVVGARSKAQEAAAAAPRDPRAQEQLARTALAALDFSAAEASAARAVELDETPARLVLLTEARAARKVFEAAAAARSQPPPPSSGGGRLGVILIVLAVAGLFGWILGVTTKSADEETGEDAVPPQSLLPGDGRLEPREALQALEAAAVAEPDPLALAESLYQRLTGRRAFLHARDRARGRYHLASRANKNYPLGLDAFFARALAPEPAQRFKTAVELVGAFRSLIDPAVL
jgi:hypothetical protein